MWTTLLSQSQNYGLAEAVYLWLFYVGFQSCHPHTEQFPSLSLQQQEQIMPLSTSHYRNLIEATKDEMDEEKDHTDTENTVIRCQVPQFSSLTNFQNDT